LGQPHIHQHGAHHCTHVHLPIGIGGGHGSSIEQQKQRALVEILQRRSW